MRDNSRLILIIFIILLSMPMIGCNSTLNYQKSIFDDESKIIKSSDSFSYRNKLGKIEGNEIDIEFSSFTGSDTICKILVSEESHVTFDFNGTIDEGSFKALVITPDDEIINILDGTGEGEESILLPEGMNRVKFVGKKAKGEIKIHIHENSNIEIKENVD